MVSSHSMEDNSKGECKHLRIAVGRFQATRAGDVGWAILKNVSGRSGVALKIAVKVGGDSERGIDEMRVLNKNLRVHAGVNTRGGVVLEAGVVNMTSAETKRRET